MLQFVVLGRLEVRDGERVVDLGPARRASVLAALLVDVGRVVPVDVLAERVWDGRPPTSAVGTLQAHVSRLRAALGDAAVLRTTASGYVLDVAGEAVDADRFEAAVARAHELLATGDPVGARREVTAALGLWSGRAYGDVVADFATTEAARLDDVRLTAHELAAELDVATGHAGQAADRLGPIVAEHPFRERLRAALVAALVATGRRVDALACLRDGRRLLVDELGVEPGERLRALQEEILADGAGDAGPVPDDPPDDPPLPTAAPPPDEMVGRGDELAAVLEVCRNATAGVTGFVALRGEAGIGKTRLAEEVSSRTAAQGQVVAWGRCWRHAGSPALWPWIEVVRDLDQATAPDVLAAALEGRGAPLSTIVPELAGEVPRPAGDDVAEVRVFDAVLHVLGRLGAARPLLVVIDDAQWADPWSRRLLEYLAGHARDLRLTLLVTLRAGGDGREDPGLGVLAGLSRSGRLVAVELDGLGADDVGALVAARTGRRLDAATSAALRARTEGNPFYVGEIARLVGDDDPGATALPDTVRGVIGQRLATLPSADAEMLAVGAVVGRAFDLELVADVAGLDEDTVDGIVDRAVRAGVLREEPTDEGDLRFAHALLAETLLDEVGPSRRRRLHRRIAATLTEQRRHPTGRRPAPDRVARHHLAAGGDADLRVAVELLLEAADDALRQRSVLEVERLLDEAATSVGRIGHGSEDVARAVRARRATFDALVRGPAGTGGVRAPIPTDLSAHATAALDATELVTVVYAQWTWPMARGRVRAAARLSDELSRLAAVRDDDLLRLSAAVMRSCDRFLRGSLGEARAAASEADELLAVVADPPRVLTPHPAISNPVWEAYSLLLTGHRDDAHRLYATVRDRARRLADLPPVQATLLDMYDVHWWTFNDEPDQVAPAVERVREAVERTGMTSMTYFVAMPEAWAIGHDDGARGAQLARAAAAHIDEPDSLAYRPLFRGLHAEILLWTGDPDAALVVLDAGLGESTASGQALWDAELHRLRARALAAGGAPSSEIAAATARARAVAVEQGATLFLARIDADARG